MDRSWLFIFVSALFIMTGCFSSEPNDAQNNDLVVENNSDTLKTPKEEIDSVKTGLDELESPEENTTKNIPDIEEEPEKPVKPVVVKKSGPKISFTEMNYSWGEIEQGEKVTKAFTFKNTGDMPLNILSASATCGCTMPSYPFLPINPGKTGKIEVTYDSKLKYGAQEAKVTVQTDAYPKTYFLMLSGNVKEKPKEEKDEEKPPKDSTSSEGS